MDDQTTLSLIGAVRLRSYLKLIRYPDQIADCLIGAYARFPAVSYTERFDLAKIWVRWIAPDISHIEPIQVGYLWSVRAWVGDRELFFRRSAMSVGIPTCLVGLNHRIETLMKIPDLNKTC